jgi:hypothetical protein
MVKAGKDDDGQGNYKTKIQDGATRHNVYVNSEGTIYQDKIKHDRRGQDRDDDDDD